ncbi:MAG: hypothetical protein J0M37_08790 [Ignavibacteria bacterium]|nr:hypothetical protein [Ignavibacteria bacterium]
MSLKALKYFIVLLLAICTLDDSQSLCQNYTPKEDILAKNFRTSTLNFKMSNTSSSVKTSKQIYSKCNSNPTLKNNYHLSDSTLLPDKNPKYYTLFSLYAGASTYRFLNLYFFEANIFYSINEKLYLKNGITIFREIKRDPYQTNPAGTLFHLNVFLYRLWQLNNNIIFFTGGGIKINPISLLPCIELKIDFKIIKGLYLGLNWYQTLVYPKKSSNYIIYPMTSIILSIKL